MKPVPRDYDLVVRRIRDSVAVKQLALEDRNYIDTVRAAAKAMAESLRNGHKVLFFGNGGSAADAQHLAAELTGRYLQERPSLAGMTLTTNTSSLTAISNDYSYDLVFARQLQGLGSPGDVAVGISTSGNSVNVLKAMEVAKAKGMVTLGLSGKSGGKLRDIVDYCVCVPSTETPRIQEVHILTGHIMCEIVERELFCAGNPAIFLDRDGVVNRKPPDGAYVASVAEFEVLPGALEAIADLGRCGYDIFVITNQRGIARGRVSRSQLCEIHARMLDLVHEAGGHIKEVYVCPHDDIDLCDCRKPKPGLLLRAQREHRIAPHNSWMIGDSVSDILAGKRAGCHTVLIGSGDAHVSADICASSLQDAVSKLKSIAVAA